MKTIKPQRIAILHRCFQDGQKFYLSLAGMFYFPFAEPRRLLPEVCLWKETAEVLGKNAILDFGFPKPRAEVLICGKAYTPGGRPMRALEVKLEVGALSKTLEVRGDRSWKMAAGELAPGDPEFFTEMPLVWERAYGGPGHEANPVGVGYSREPLEAGMPIPNIEVPDQIWTHPDETPVPAGFAPVDVSWPCRQKKFGTFDDEWLRTRFPGLAADHDWEAFNAAPADQWLPGFLAGGEAFALVHMHPDEARLEGWVPDAALRVFATLQNGEEQRFVECPMRRETLWLFPSIKRAALIWRGVMEINTEDAEDVLHLVIGADAADAPRPAQHYADLLMRRLDRMQAALEAVDESPLLPPLPEGPLPEEQSELTGIIRTKRLFDKRFRVRVEAEDAAMKKKLAEARANIVASCAEANVPLPDLKALDEAITKPLPPVPPPPKLEELPKLQKQYQEQMKQFIAEAEVKKKEAVEGLKKMVAEQKPHLQATAPAEVAKLEQAVAMLENPPPATRERPKLSEMMAELQKTLAESEKSLPAEAKDAAGDKLAEAQKSIAKMQVDGGKAGADMDAMMRRHAAFLPPLPPLSEEEKAAILEEVRNSRKKQFAGRDFSCADLSGLDLSGADFTDAILESVNFSGAMLKGANFAGATLVRANLSGATLDGADLSGADLGFADLSGAQMSKAKLENAKLIRTNFDGANLEGAKCGGADFLGARFAGAVLKGIEAPKGRFLDIPFSEKEATATPGGKKLPMSDFSGSDWSKANLTKALFLNCYLHGAQFRHAAMDQALFLSCRAEGADFSKAGLKGFIGVKDTALPGCNFSEANLSQANLMGIDLAGGVFTGAVLDKALLTKASLRGAKLNQVQGAGVRLDKADLTGSTLEDSDFRESVFRRTRLVGANLHRTSLFMADVWKIKVDDKTHWKGSNLKKTLLEDGQK